MVQIALIVKDLLMPGYVAVQIQTVDVKEYQQYFDGFDPRYEEYRHGEL